VANAYAEGAADVRHVAIGAMASRSGPLSCHDATVGWGYQRIGYQEWILAERSQLDLVQIRCVALGNCAINENGVRILLQ
jgi:hypothetical protein